MAIIAVGDFDEELVQQQIKVGPFPVWLKSMWKIGVWYNYCGCAMMYVYYISYVLCICLEYMFGDLERIYMGL